MSLRVRVRAFLHAPAIEYEAQEVAYLPHANRAVPSSDESCLRECQRLADALARIGHMVEPNRYRVLDLAVPKPTIPNRAPR